MKKTDIHIERFEEKFVKTDSKSCWNWLASTSSKGYGWFRVGKSMIRSHRVSYTLYKGKIPVGLHVLHKCDNPSCVNPDHLFLGTNLDNVKDKVNKGRVPDLVGDKNPRAKLSLLQVSVIREALKAGHSQRKIGKYFNISDSTVGAINTGQNWTK